MKHLSSIVLAAAVVAAGAVACFKDPTSSLRNGATRIEVTRTAMTLVTGDSLSIQAEVKDDQGNSYDAVGLTWTTDNAAVATVASDTSKPIPYGAFAKAFVLAVGPTGGVAHITATHGNLTAVVRVLNLPAQLTPSAAGSFRGPTNVADTIVIRNPDHTVTVDAFTTGDTVVYKLAAGSPVTFNADATVDFGATPAYILAQSADSIKVVARNTFHGRPWITGLTWHGPAEVGNVAVDSLQADDIRVAKPRYHGAIAVSAGVVMTINAPPTGLTFRTGAPKTEVTINGKTASIISRTATSLVVADTAVGDSSGFTGGVIVSNVDYSGGITFDSLWSTASQTITRIVFPGTINTPASLMDTIKVRAPGMLDAATSEVTTDGVSAWILYRSADSIFALAKQPGAIVVTNVTYGGVTFGSLSPAHTINAPKTPTGAPNEPGNDSRATATVVSLTGTTAANPLLVYGAMNANGDYWDYYTFTLASASTVTATISWFGDGSGSDTGNPDFDVIICGPAPVAACSYANDLAGNVAAGSSQPETFTIALAAGTYFVRTYAYSTADAVVYRLALNLP